MATPSSQNIKILHTLPKLDIGGVEKFVVDLVTQNNHCQIQHYVASCKGKLVQQLRQNNVTHFDLPIHKKNIFVLLLNIYRLYRLIKQYKIDIIHTHSRIPAWCSLGAAKLQKIPLITTFHGTYNFNNKIKKYYNSIMVRGNKVIAISKFIAEHIATNYSEHVTKNNLTLITEGIKLAQFNSSNIAAARVKAIRQRIGFAANKKVILMPARITHWKGQHIMLQALKIIVATTPDILLLFAGDFQGKTQYLQQLQDYIAKANISSNVIFCNNIDDMPALYLASNIVVNPSIEPEAFGRTIIEAQALQIPVIASHLGAPAYQIQNNVTGWLCTPGNYIDLAKKIIYVLALPPEAKTTITQQALLDVQKKYDIKQMIQKHIDLYEEICK